MRHPPIVLAALLALAACSPASKDPPQECRDNRTGWVGRKLGGNLSYVWLADKDGWERTYRYEDVECRPLPQ